MTKHLGITKWLRILTTKDDIPSVSWRVPLGSRSDVIQRTAIWTGSTDQHIARVNPGENASERCFLLLIDWLRFIGALL